MPNLPALQQLLAQDSYDAAKLRDGSLFIAALLGSTNTPEEEQQKEHLLRKLLSLGSATREEGKYANTPWAVVARNPSIGTRNHDLYQTDPEAYYQVKRDASNRWMDLLDEWQIDPSVDAHKTLAELARQDVLHLRPNDKTIPQLQASPLPHQWELVVARGVPLQSPIDCPAWDSPLAVALENGLVGAVKTMMSQGVDPCWVDPDNGDTVFSVVARSPAHATKALLAIPPDKLRPLVQRANAKGDTPLHLAVQSMNPDLVAYVLSCGADPTVKNKQGKLPLETVKRTGAKAQKNLARIAEMLEAGGAAPAEDGELVENLMKACSALSTDMVLRYLAAGASANATNKRGETPLIKVAQAIRGHAPGRKLTQALQEQAVLVHELTAAGAQVDAADKTGSTALHYAVKTVRNEAVKLLLEAGANPNRCNKAGQMPGHMVGEILPFLWDENLDATQEDYRFKAMLATAKHMAAHGADLAATDANDVPCFPHIMETPRFKALLEEDSLQKGTRPSTGASKSRRI